MSEFACFCAVHPEKGVNSTFNKAFPAAKVFVDFQSADNAT